MIIKRKYFDEESWEEITLTEFIRTTEENGCYRPGSALGILEDCGKLKTTTTEFIYEGDSK